MKDQADLIILFQKYIKGECTPDEIAAFFELIKNGENEAMLLSLISNELDTDPQENSNRQAEEKALHRVRAELISEIRSAEPGTNVSYSLLRKVLRSEWLRIAALWIVLSSAAMAGFYRYFSHRQNQFANTKTLSTGKGERKMLRLFDGTKIWLYPSSKFTFSDQLVNSKRQVTLDGEAFFEVAKDHKHPFIIHSGNMQTEVVGTSFDVKSYRAQSAYSVTVVTGIVKVSLWSNPDTKIKEVTLRPKQAATFYKASNSLRDSVMTDLKPVVSRRDGILTYNGAPVVEVVADLNHYYHSAIKLDGGNYSCLFFGSFDSTKPVETALKQLSAAINARLKTDGDTYTLEGGCDGN